MTVHQSPVSVRVPTSMVKHLDKLAQESRRTRSSLMVEAIEVFLDLKAIQKQSEQRKGRFDAMLKFRGKGAAVAKPLTAEEISALIQEHRGDD